MGMSLSGRTSIDGRRMTYWTSNSFWSIYGLLLYELGCDM